MPEARWRASGVNVAEFRRDLGEPPWPRAVVYDRVIHARVALISDLPPATCSLSPVP